MFTAGSIIIATACNADLHNSPLKLVAQNITLEEAEHHYSKYGG